jgi:hypothetical protein
MCRGGGLQNIQVLDPLCKPLKGVEGGGGHGNGEVLGGVQKRSKQQMHNLWGWLSGCRCGLREWVRLEILRLDLA